MRSIPLLRSLIMGISVVVSSVAAEAANNVVATFTATSKTLNLTGNSSNNFVTMSNENGKLTLTGTNGTTINGASTWSVNFTGTVTLTGSLKGGSDQLTLTKCTITSPLIQLGAGNDTLIVDNANATFTTLDGGLGSDRLLIRNKSNVIIKYVSSM